MSLNLLVYYDHEQFDPDSEFLHDFLELIDLRPVGVVHHQLGDDVREIVLVEKLGEGVVGNRR
jgi:hypothetical protein